jgi:hypothetical protein
MISLLTALLISGAVGAFGYVTGRVDNARQGKVSPARFDELPRKSVPPALPPTIYEAGPGTGYRELTAPRQCAVCKRTCVHCRREQKRRR